MQLPAFGVCTLRHGRNAGSARYPVTQANDAEIPTPLATVFPAPEPVEVGQCATARRRLWSWRAVGGTVLAQHDARAALVGPVGQRPVEQHADPVAKADQEDYVRGQPEPPGEQARELEPA